MAFASAPVAAFAAGRQLPRDNNPPNKGASTIQAEITPHTPDTPEHKYGKLADISRDSFQAAVGSAFKLTNTSGKAIPFWLTLTSVQDLIAVTPANQASMAVAPPLAMAQSINTSGFSLVFWGGPLPMVQQETFFFEHADLGQFAMFIVPAGRQFYTAVINRLSALSVSPR